MNKRVAQALGVLAVLAIGCDISIQLPMSAPLPTTIPGLVDTIIAATAGAAQTQTAAMIPPTLTPTFTPLPTRTPTLTPTLTPTFFFFLRSATPIKKATPTGGDSGSSSDDLACRLMAQSPEDGSHFGANKKFDAVWEVKNIGIDTWNKNSVDFAYSNGTKMHDQDPYDLELNVGPGASIDLAVEMTSPKNPGKYKTVWTLRRGNEFFCHVDLSIVVP